jgi:hypothetical protein
MMTLNLFTFVCEYDGGTYTSQVRAHDQIHALNTWAALLRDEQPIEGMSNLLAKAAGSTPDEPAALTGVKGVWCWSTIVANKLALIHIVRTSDH